MSEQVAKILSERNQFQLECRGPIEVRGKGILTTYLVIPPIDCLDSYLEPSSGIEGLSADSEDENNKPSPPPALEDEEDGEVEELCNSREQL